MLILIVLSKSVPGSTAAAMCPRRHWTRHEALPTRSAAPAERRRRKFATAAAELCAALPHGEVELTTEAGGMLAETGVPGIGIHTATPVPPPFSTVSRPEDPRDLVGAADSLSTP